MQQFWTALPDTLANGLAQGMMYALIALGYTLVYGILELINFAHGDVFMLGGLLSWGVLNRLFGGPLGDNFGVLGGGTLALAVITALVIAMVSCGAIGFGIEKFAYRPLRNAPRLAPLVTAIGVSFIIENAVLVWQNGSGNVTITYPALVNQSIITAFGLHLQSKAIVVFIAAPILMAGLILLVNYTRIGKAMRATAQDPEAARMMGIDVNTIISITFVVGSALAGAAAVIYCMYYNYVSYDMGFLVGLKAFTAAVLGGIGNIRGAMLGGVLIGEVEAVSNAAGNGVGLQWSESAVFLVLMLVLILRPSGLLGAQVVEKA
ncbi:MAG: branched-chain amino acid ABC transporter permease [Chloroflexota bacterium]